MPARQMTVCFSGYRPEKLPWGYDECDPRCAQLKQRLRRAVCAACDDGTTVGNRDGSSRTGRSTGTADGKYTR